MKSGSPRRLLPSSTANTPEAQGSQRADQAKKKQQLRQMLGSPFLSCPFDAQFLPPIPAPQSQKKEGNACSQDAKQNPTGCGSCKTQELSPPPSTPMALGHLLMYQLHQTTHPSPTGLTELLSSRYQILHLQDMDTQAVSQCLSYTQVNQGKGQTVSLLSVRNGNSASLR